MRSPPPSLLVLLGVVVLVAMALARTAEIRDRAERGLGQGMPPREAALARGFVLGADEEIDPVTREDFRRSGLSHLLAVSGQNVTLLGLLAMPLLAALGIPLRERLLWILALIAVYVPLAGAGPTIQRAAVMGAVGLLATLGGRRAPRFHALALAFLVTVAIDPSVAADVGWQLSFAAVLGIILLAPSLRRAILARSGTGALRAAFAAGVAITVAATLATAPLIAFYFQSFSTTTLLANVLAMPAVAPAMWLGMASAAAAQVPGLPVEILNGPNSLLLAYIAQVAAWCGRPGWAQVQVELGLGGLAVSYLLLALGCGAVALVARWRRLSVARRRPAADRRLAIPAAVGPALLALALWGLPGGAPAAGPPPPLRIVVFDVGQGDAILLQAREAPALLVDTGPPGGDIVAALRSEGVERLGATIVTHDQSDHAGGLGDLLGGIAVARVGYARLGREALAAARAAGAAPMRLSAGSVLRSGPLSLEVLWPPRALLEGPQVVPDPNQLSLVMLVRWHDFSMLLAADAEAEAVPLDPGPLDVLKVAHHGSADAGLAGLAERTRPRLAVISVGAGNPYGHPDPGTLAALAAHGIPALRTDREGDLTIGVWRGFFALNRGN